MKKIFLAFLLLFSAQIIFAQNDQTAKTILDDVSKKIKSLKSLKANFSITITGGKNQKPQTKSGIVNMKGEKYYVNLSGQEIYCDTKTIWTYMKESNEVQITSFDPNENSFTPSKLFTNFYDKEYSYKYAGEKTVNGKKVVEITLTPVNKTKQFTKIELYVDKANNVVAGGKMYEKNGNIYSYNVSRYVHNPVLADNSFTFDSKKYPKVEIVDLR
ncbi:MAG: outer membrane lipoprotein carrier protein LolA [Chitinophagaceae bacterium]|nr:outer membrane lipoprotein carrier protein LolA [Chitinophagaceae bacterium]HMN33589.1 outer membrane lipoprotein carrier protein LolA [Chitinophagaceae bacterium]